MKIKRLLVANRGEIAVRIIRTCKEMGIETVAVYSDADAAALHVAFADYAYPIGPGPAHQSYLLGEKIIDIAKQAGAQAIHPGYGFLSENDEFAGLCEKNGLIFVGPTAASMFAVGDKVRARQLAQQHNVPLIPGSPPLKHDADAKKYLGEIGFPLLIKCSGGGGGHGMRLVEKAGDLEMALKMTRAEGKKAFDDDTIYIERALREPRHIEVQLFGLGDGRVVHLFTRACSVQRRHQKVIEEAPAPKVMAAKLRQIEQDAVKLASAIQYRGAGTAEFLLDRDGQHYFLEMNTRLQVEHAVTEMVLGIDLVALQIQLAAGNDLSAPIIALHEKQKSTQTRGHAIQCRIYAENPLQQFSPAPGKIQQLRMPEGPGVRVDNGIYAGFTIPIFYDAMIAKIITWGSDREQARLRMLRALDETVITGIQTNLAFLKVVLQNGAFIAGDYSTRMIDDEKILKTLQESQQALPEVVVAATTIELLERLKGHPVQGDPLSAWQQTTSSLNKDGNS